MRSTEKAGKTFALVVNPKYQRILVLPDNCSQTPMESKGYRRRDLGGGSVRFCWIILGFSLRKGQMHAEKIQGVDGT
jgi:hypothetical protein